MGNKPSVTDKEYPPITFEDYKDNVGYKLVQFLRCRYVLSDVFGIRGHEFVSVGVSGALPHVGLLEELPPKKFLCFRIKQRANFIGELAFGQPTWILTVYGRENVPQFQTLAWDLFNTFNVPVNVILETAYPKKEQTMTEFAAKCGG